jgi:hypothetical protein
VFLNQGMQTIREGEASYQFFSCEDVTSDPWKTQFNLLSKINK